MSTRRGFMAGLLATGLAPQISWADAGRPRFLSAAREENGQYVLCGLSELGEILFKLPLPDRGHAAASHPSRPEAVCFARRPGRFAFVIDCMTGEKIAQMDAPEGRHFYGHGVYSADGAWLYTTENDYDAARGVVGVWDVKNGYRRAKEVASGGIGPHDIKRLSGTDILVVANGGIETHPDSGRTKLNLAMMQPNLSYLDHTGAILEHAELPKDMRLGSIRHMAVCPDGVVAFGLQWQGDPAEVFPLVGVHRRGRDMKMFPTTKFQGSQLQGYVGSIAVNATGTHIAATSPRGGIFATYEINSGTCREIRSFKDVCGVAGSGNSFVLTSGSGEIRHIKTGKPGNSHVGNPSWDNHLISVG
ncbi:MAG: DUF1513 domain-containing protein [Rhodobacteraceae bacterium]|nr:DUF1513 domain-containing protein [Paracoccaceae bacterium]